MRKTIKRAVTTIYFEDVKENWEQWFLLTSDVHFDSTLCNRDLLTKHFDKAKNIGAYIMIFGDLFDAMQGRFDPRRSMAELRPEYRRNNYYDFVVNDVTSYLANYKDNLVLIARGNHETAVIKNAGIDLSDRLVFHLNTLHKADVILGGYGGWIRLMMEHPGKDGPVPESSISMKYFHGAGGEAPVTRGAIQTNRQAVYLPDADIVVNGHSHNAYDIPIARERLSNKGNLYFDVQHHIRTPGYKQDYADGSGGWTVERGGVPKPIGSVWMRLYKEDGKTNMQFIADVTGSQPVDPVGFGIDENYRPFNDDIG